MTISKHRYRNAVPICCQPWVDTDSTTKGPPRRCSTRPSGPSPSRASTPFRCARWPTTPARQHGRSTPCSNHEGWAGRRPRPARLHSPPARHRDAASDRPTCSRPRRGGPRLPTVRARAPGALLDRIPPCRPGHLAALRAAAIDALVVLDKRFEALADADLLCGRSIAEASTQFRALCEGVAWTELRGNPLPPDPERFWRNAFHALITGLAIPPPRAQRRTTRSRRAAASTSRD